ncbi:MAG TPA: hypothetical protein ENN29_07940 [Candidatus Hydrogenedentes bacterium]|nr:hypothetical protein [Candidatus Hydrogenedentota bacterium]
MKRSAVWFGAFALTVAVMMTLIPRAVGEDAAEGDLAAIEIELPEPFFGGTPLDYWGPNLEPQDFRDRPPFMAPKGAVNAALGKTVAGSAPPVHGELKQITDGDKHYARTSLVEIPAGVQWVQVDLEKEHDIYAILVWHFHEGNRVYFDIVAQVSNDPEFNEEVETVYNNDHDNSSGLGVGEDKEYIESYKGRLIDANGVSGRYVRLYSNGNTADDFNHYVEIEVYGIPKTS